jgi:fatty-acyl-CoA synthase
VLCDGWLDTGDLGFIHHGELYITGRAKDVLVLRGRNHAPEEVEQAIDGIEGVRTGCSVAVSWLADGASSEQLLVMAEVRRNVIAKEHAGIADACRSAVLAATGLEVHRMVVLEAGTLPRTSSGKLLRSEALRLYLTGDLTPPEPVNAWRLAGAVARSQLAYARMGWRTSGVED